MKWRYRRGWADVMIAGVVALLAAHAGNAITAVQSVDHTMTSAQIDELWTIDDAKSGLAKLTQALTQFPGSADELHTQICRSLGLLGRFDEAWAELAKVSQLRSPIVEVRYQLEAGRLKNSSGSPEEAIPYFKKALTLAKEAKFDYYAVDAAHMLGIATKGKESVDWNEEALAMAAKSTDVRAQKWRGSLLNNLGWTYFNSGEFEKALNKFDAAHDYQVEHGSPVAIRISRWAIARCYRAMHRYADALAILNDLIQFPEAGYVSEELGEDLLAIGKKDEAKPHFKRAYELLSADPYLVAHEKSRLDRLKALSSE